MNSRLDTIQAAILLPKLEILDEEIELRQEVAARYDQLFNEIGISTTPYVDPDCLSAFAQYTVCMIDRDSVQARLKEAGIPSAIHYPIPLNRQPAVADENVRLAVSEEIAEQVISLPMHPYLDLTQQATVVEAIRS